MQVVEGWAEPWAELAGLFGLPKSNLNARFPKSAGRLSHRRAKGQRFQLFGHEGLRGAQSDPGWTIFSSVRKVGRIIKLPDPVLSRSPGHYRDWIRAC